MSYRIDFRIGCPQCFSYEQEPYHASIVILQSPDSPEPFLVIRAVVAVTTIALLVTGV